MAVLSPGAGALFITPSQRVQAKIIPWRRIYDPENERAIPPHITLGYPFVRAEEWPAARPVVMECLRAFPPFWITLAELGAFEHPDSVLWFRPDDGGALARIHAALAASFPAHFRPGPLPYVPHLTVGIFDSAEALAQARAAISAVWQPLRFRVTAVRYGVLEMGGWRVHDEPPLANVWRE